MHDFGLLILRLGLGVQMAVLHGWPKFQMVLDGKGEGFPDPLGIGGAQSLLAAAVTELVFSGAVAAGLFTRFTAIPVAVTMGVAAFIHHADDPWSKKESALVYMAGFAALVLLGGGRLCIDRLFLGKKKI